MIQKILIPVDFSERSAQAARYGNALAGRFDAEVILLHALERVHFDYSMIEPPEETSRAVLESNRRKVQDHLDAFASSEFPDVRVTKLLVQGDPADQILCASRREQASLIVMPTQGRSRLRQFLIGSVTAKVLHDSPVPVWTGVHLHRDVNFPDLRLKHILCAIDFGSQTNAALAYAARLSEEFKASLTVLHVLSPANMHSERIATIERAHAHVHDLLQQTGITANSNIDFGEPHRVVAATAGRLHADVVVIGRAGSTGMMGRLREQSYAIVRDSPCPVLSV